MAIERDSPFSIRVTTAISLGRTWTFLPRHNAKLNAVWETQDAAAAQGETCREKHLPCNLGWVSAGLERVYNTDNVSSIIQVKYVGVCTRDKGRYYWEAMGVHSFEFVKTAWLSIETVMCKAQFWGSSVKVFQWNDTWSNCDNPRLF